MRALSLLLIPLLGATLLAGDRWEASHSIGGVVLTGDYEEFPVNGLIEQSIEVDLQGAPAGARVVFELDGARFGSAVADAGGRARLTAAYHQVPPDPQGRPDGRRVNDGSVLRASVGSRAIEAVFQPVP